MLSKSERNASETMKQWLEGPQVDSDEFDTDLEDDFPPESVLPSDNTGKYIYERHCLKSGMKFHHDNLNTVAKNRFEVSTFS